MSADVLSDLLRSVRLRGAVFYHVSCRDEWSAQAPPAPMVAAAVMPKAEHVMEYHMMAKGDGWAAVDGLSPVRLSMGDVVMFPHGDAHVISSAPGLAPTNGSLDLDWMISSRSDPKPIPVAFDGGVAAAGTCLDPQDASNVLVCGFLGCDLKPFNPLIGALPRILHVPRARIGGWVERVIEQAVTESTERRPGGDAVLERLSEMMFVDSVRRYLDDLPEESAGWLAGLRDRFVGRALALLHAQPEKPWTIDELGHDVGLSRSALHERFTGMVGQPPMQYLAQWRMQVAAGLLRTSHHNVADIALQVGYESEAAFSRAFKRAMGAPPAAWRRSRTAEALPA